MCAIYDIMLLSLVLCMCFHGIATHAVDSKDSMDFSEMDNLLTPSFSLMKGSFIVRSKQVGNKIIASLLKKNIIEYAHVITNETIRYDKRTKMFRVSQQQQRQIVIYFDIVFRSSLESHLSVYFPDIKVVYDIQTSPNEAEYVENKTPSSTELLLERMNITSDSFKPNKDVMDGNQFASNDYVRLLSDNTRFPITGTNLLEWKTKPIIYMDFSNLVYLGSFRLEKSMHHLKADIGSRFVLLISGNRLLGARWRLIDNGDLAFADIGPLTLINSGNEGSNALPFTNKLALYGISVFVKAPGEHSLEFRFERKDSKNIVPTKIIYFHVEDA